MTRTYPRLPRFVIRFADGTEHKRVDGKRLTYKTARPAIKLVDQARKTFGEHPLSADSIKWDGALVVKA